MVPDIGIAATHIPRGLCPMEQRMDDPVRLSLLEMFETGHSPFPDSI
jgi:hypothetical protein